MVATVVFAGDFKALCSVRGNQKEGISSDERESAMVCVAATNQRCGLVATWRLETRQRQPVNTQKEAIAFVLTMSIQIVLTQKHTQDMETEKDNRR